MTATQPSRYQVGALLLDTRQRSASVDGRPVRLTYAEAEALRVFIAADGEPVSRAALAQQVLRLDEIARADRRLDSFISVLRRKLPRCADGAPLIRAVRGLGYWMPPGNVVP